MKFKRKGIKWSLKIAFCFIFGALFLNEFLIYYILTLKCIWPALIDELSKEPVFAMVLADTHLLGLRNGHWWDKLRREWQMHRAFQTAVTIHNPDIIFMLGDIFDEGLWASDEEFQNYVKRFHSLFALPVKTPMVVVAGNHDIGFHYATSRHLESRFRMNMNSSLVKLLTVKNIHFVLINSIAMEGDGCSLCKRAEQEVRNISQILRCNKNGTCLKEPKLYYSQPILLQHFPLYRKSDEECIESIVAPKSGLNDKFRERWECLSNKSTNYLIDNLHPRLAISGHTHHPCFMVHRAQVPGQRKTGAPMFVEYSTPSFSWRNRNDPSFFMVVASPAEFRINSCDMPKESTVIRLYIVFAIGFILVILYKLLYSGKKYQSYYKLN